MNKEYFLNKLVPIATSFTIISFLIGAFNLTVGIAGGVWLIIVGKWILVAIAVLLTLSVAKAFTPLAFVATPSAKALKENKYSAIYTLGAWTILWDYIWMSFWCIGSFFLIINSQDTMSIWPYLLFGYFVAIWPSTYNASMAYLVKLIFVFLGTIAMMAVTLLYGKPTLEVLIITFVIAMIIGWIIQVGLFVSIVKSNIEAAKNIMGEGGLDADEVVKLSKWH
ncbi:MAG: hypothetical protein WAN50_03285 [Minisyncoccia bacterium]